jgi:hypothetical protein
MDVPGSWTVEEDLVIHSAFHLGELRILYFGLIIVVQLGA